MSGIGDFLFGESAQPGTVQDLSSPEARVARDDAIKLVRGFLDGGGLNPFPGQTTAQLSDRENQLLGLLDQRLFSDGFPTIQAGSEALTNIAGTTPTGSFNPLFLPGNPGQVAGNENIMEILSGNTQDTRVNPLFAPGNPAGVAGNQQVFDILTGATQDPNNEIIQNAITAATRPIIEQFQDDVDINRNLFTRAGQFVQPGSSSPFELAQSRLSTGLANALGDTSSQIVFDNLASERARQSNLINTLSNSFDNAEARVTAERGRQLDLISTLSNSFDNAENRRVNERGQQLQAATATVPFERSQLQALDEVLQTSALPRLIEQFGLTQGREIFENEQNSLLNLLQLAFQGTNPLIATTPGSAGSPGLVQSLAGGVAAGAGGPIGTALANAIF